MSYGRLVSPSKVRIPTHTLQHRNGSEDLTRSSVTDDARMLYAARVEARSRFNNNRSLPVDSMDTLQKINEAEEVARILRQNVVQGQKVEGTGLEDRRYRTYDLYTKTLVQQGYYNGWMEHE